MGKILKYKEYCLIKEDSEFNQYQMDTGVQNPLGPGYGWATDPSLSIYGQDDGKFVDQYARQSGLMNHLMQIVKNINRNDNLFDIKVKKIDSFLEDVDKYTDLKILRIFPNDTLNLDVYISFKFEDEEFFGVYKKFNGFSKPKLESEILTDPRFNYIDKEYYLKLSNYFYKILYNWFIPNKGLYKNLKDNNKLIDDFGREFNLKIGSVVEVLGYNKELDKKPFLKIKYKDKNYVIDNNDFFFFNYWFEKV